jgi:hypothetical protein
MDAIVHAIVQARPLARTSSSIAPRPRGWCLRHRKKAEQRPVSGKSTVAGGHRLHGRAQSVSSVFGRVASRGCGPIADSTASQWPGSAAAIVSGR